MQRWISALSVLLAVQLALAGLLAMRADRVTTAPADTPLLAMDTKAIDHITIDGKALVGEKAPPRVELVKQHGQWLVHNDFDVPANAFKVDDLIGKLSGVKRGLPIATSREALQRFKVDDDNFERRISLGANGKTLTTVYLGDSPGVRKSDARTANDQAVYVVELPTYELPVSTDQWFKSDLLKVSTDKLAEIDFDAATAHGLKLTHAAASSDAKDQSKATADSWQAKGLARDQQLDNARAEALATELANLTVSTVLGQTAKPEWQTDHPLLELTLKDKQGHTQTLSLSKLNDGKQNDGKQDTSDTYVLKSSSRPWYFGVTSSEAKSLLDASNPATLTARAETSAPKATHAANAASSPQHDSRKTG